MSKIAPQNDNEIGEVVSYFSGVGKIKGLSRVFLHEVLVNERRAPVALVVGFDEHEVEALFFDEAFDPAEKVLRSGEVFSVTVTESMIGRVIDGLGAPLDDLGPVRGEKMPAFRSAPAVIEREQVREQLLTGIKIIDTTLPLGRGQRELIIGDRKIGKSTLAIDTVLNQKYAHPPMYCVYVLCGQKEQKLRELISIFNEYNAFLYSVIVAAPAGTSFANQYLAPFVGCVIGEYFRDRGDSALIVYDDFSKHAKAYRDIALLLERAPDRETYPGDIFSVHAGLLERAAKLSHKRGGGSLSALPIIETEEGDIASFIATNMTSITDGQIYLERGLFQKGFLPAVNVGLSVSRVGSKVQPELLRYVTDGIRLALVQHKELQKLSQLENTASQEAQKNIFRGELTLEVLKQRKHTAISWAEQTILFYSVEAGFLDDIDKEKWVDFEKHLLQLIRNRYFDLIEQIEKKTFDEKIKSTIMDMLADFKREFLNAI